MSPGKFAGNGAAPLRWHVRVVMTGLPLQSCAVLLSHAAEHIVVDTGFPQHDELLLEGLAQAGVAREQVTGIINTHFHLDHFGGNALFPQAWVYGSRRDYDWALPIYETAKGGPMSPEVVASFYPEVREEELKRMEQARVQQLLRWMWDPATLGDLSRYRWLEEHPWTLSGIRIVPTPGHTPGHISVEVDGVDGRYLVLGDARAFADEAAVGYDMPPHNHAQYQRSREWIARFEGILIPGHDDPFSQSPASSEAESGRSLDEAALTRESE